MRSAAVQDMEKLRQGYDAAQRAVAASTMAAQKSRRESSTAREAAIQSEIEKDAMRQDLAAARNKAIAATGEPWIPCTVTTRMMDAQTKHEGMMGGEKQK